MSARRIERALSRLAAPQAVLALDRRSGGYGVYSRQDMRRRPSVRLSAADVRELAGAGGARLPG